MKEYWDLAEEAMDKCAKSRLDLVGYECLVCGKIIKMKTYRNDYRGHGFMKISMIGHIKAHIKRGEITQSTVGTFSSS